MIDSSETFWKIFTMETIY